MNDCGHDFPALFLILVMGSLWELNAHLFEVSLSSAVNLEPWHCAFRKAALHLHRLEVLPRLHSATCHGRTGAVDDVRNLLCTFVVSVEIETRRERLIYSFPTAGL